MAGLNNDVALPPQLKSISMYIKTASELEKKDKVVGYYCRVYAVQKGMEIDRRTPECKSYLISLMDLLEREKNELREEEGIKNSMVGQALVEQSAFRLFSFADKKDREGDFGPSTVKAFYTAGLLMDVLGSFDEVSDEIEKCRKYAKWKALYITQCRRNGETPHAGPLNEDGAAESPDINAAFANHKLISLDDNINKTSSVPTPVVPPIAAPRSNYYQMPSESQIPVVVNQGFTLPAAESGATADIQLKTEDYQTCQKYCKYATSALNYQDSKTAIDYLTRALNLLTKGKE